MGRNRRDSLQQVRSAVEILQASVLDPHAPTVRTQDAHRRLVEALPSCDVHLARQIAHYLETVSKPAGYLEIREAVLTLAVLLKLPPTRRLPRPGVQMNLFDR